jgi:DNA-binding CsgD family transcriptional regulator
MARLVESDYRKALDVLYAAGEVDGSVAFPEPVLGVLRELIPCDVVAFHEGGWRADRVLVYTGEPIGPMTSEVRAGHRRLKHHDPLRPAESARTLTDFVPMRKFRQTEFYNLVHRPIGVEYILQLYLDPHRTDARFEFDRADADFGERDRDVLDLLLPHLRQLLRTAARRPTAPDPATKLTSRELEVIAHVAEGRTNIEIAQLLGISAHTVRKHLENAYMKLGTHTRTGAVAASMGQRPPTSSSKKWSLEPSAPRVDGRRPRRH